MSNQFEGRGGDATTNSTVANNPAAFAYTFGSLRSTNAAYNATSQRLKNNDPSAVSAHYAQREAEAHQQHVKGLTDIFKTYEKALGKVRLLWAEVLHVCPEGVVVSALSGSVGGKSLAQLREEAEYERVVLDAAGASPSSSQSLNGHSAAVMGGGGGSGYSPQRRPPTADGWFLNNNSMNTTNNNNHNTTSSDVGSLPHHPLLVPSHPLSSADSYDAVREVLQRWVYSVSGVGLRSPHEHLYCLEERREASNALIRAANLHHHHASTTAASSSSLNASLAPSRVASAAHQRSALAGVAAANGHHHGNRPSTAPLNGRSAEFKQINVGIASSLCSPADAVRGGGGGGGDGVGFSSAAAVAASAFFSPLLASSSPSLMLSQHYSHASVLAVPFGREPSVGQLTFLRDEIQRLTAIRDARNAVEDAILVREGFLFYLQSLLAEHTAFEDDVLATVADAASFNNNGGSYAGLNDDFPQQQQQQRSSNNPFLAMELEWRSGIATLIRQIDAQVTYFETGGDVMAPAPPPTQQQQYIASNNDNDEGAAIINATAIAQQLYRLQKQQMRDNYRLNNMGGGGNTTAHQQQQQLQNGAANIIGRHRLAPQLVAGGARKASESGTLQQEQAFTSEAEAAAHQLLSQLSVSVANTFAVPQRLKPSVNPLVPVLQIGLTPPPLLVSTATLARGNGANNDKKGEDEEDDEEDDQLRMKELMAAAGERGTSANGGGNNSASNRRAGNNPTASMLNPASQFVSANPLTGSKSTQMQNNLRLMREQLGALLHTRPPIAFASASSSSSASEDNPAGSGNNPNVNNNSGAAITLAVAKQVPFVSASSSSSPAAIQHQLNLQQLKQQQQQGGGGSSGAANNSDVMNTALAFGTSPNQPNALRKALRGAIANVRRSSLDVVKAIETWRSLLLDHPAIREHNSLIYHAALRSGGGGGGRSGGGEGDGASAPPPFDPQSVLSSPPPFVPSSSSSSSSQPAYIIPIYFWRGSSYIAKMSSDLTFLSAFLAPLQERGQLIDQLVRAVGALVMQPLEGSAGDGHNVMAGMGGGFDSASLAAGVGGGPSGSSAAPKSFQNPSVGAGGGGMDAAGGASPLSLPPHLFATEFCRLRKAQRFVLRYLQKHTSIGFFVREAVATSLAEALDRCDITGNPFLNPQRKMINYSVTYSNSIANNPLASSAVPLPLWARASDYGSRPGSAATVGVGGGGGAPHPFPHTSTYMSAMGDGGGSMQVLDGLVGRPTSASSVGGVNTSTLPLPISPLLIFYSDAQRMVIYQKQEEDRNSSLEKRLGGGKLMNRMNGGGGGGGRSIIDRASGLPSTMHASAKGSGLPDILKFSHTSSAQLRSHFSDNSDARKDVTPETFLWAEGIVLGELLAMGRQLSINGSMLEVSSRGEGGGQTQPHTLNSNSNNTNLLFNQRLSSALPLQEHIDLLSRAVAKATAMALGNEKKRGDDAKSAGSIDAAAEEEDGSRCDDAAADNTTSVLRCHQFDRLSRVNAVLRHREALQFVEQQRLHTMRIREKRGHHHQHNANTVSSNDRLKKATSDMTDTPAFPAAAAASSCVPPAATAAEMDAALQVMTMNTTSRGVYVSPQVLAEMESECATIAFNSNVIDIQYNMFSVFDPSAKPPNHNAADRPEDVDSDRQMLLVLRRMGRNDATLATHLRIAAAKHAALVAQRERENKMLQQQQHGSNPQQKAKAAAAAAGSSANNNKSSSSPPATVRGGKGGTITNDKALLAASAAVGVGRGSSAGGRPRHLAGVGNNLRSPEQIVRDCKRQFERLVRLVGGGGADGMAMGGGRAGGDANPLPMTSASLEGLEERETFVSIVRVQAVWRARQATKYTRALRFLHNAARSIQSVQKCKEAVTTLSEKKTMYRAAQRIQARVRGILARRSVAMLIMVIEAATTIQRYYRGYKGRVKAGKQRAIITSATAIQKVFKGFEDRKAAEAFKSTTYNTAAVAIQKVWRGGAVRNHGAADPKRIRAAIQIQAFWRGVMARKYVARLFGVASSATRINALVRAGYERRTVIKERAEAKRQAIARGLAAVQAAEAKTYEESHPEMFELPQGSRYAKE